MGYIYIIKCKANNKIYVGSCLDFKKRKTKHISQLRSNTHKNKILQEDWNDFGEDNFIFYTREYVNGNEELLIERENYYMHEYKTHIPTYGLKFGYNQKVAIRIKDRGKSLKGKNHPMYNKNKLSGENNGNSKLSLDDCKEIFKLINLKRYSDKDIAEMFNIGLSQVNKIKNGTHWSSKHLV